MKKSAHRKYLIIISLLIVFTHIQAQNGWTLRTTIPPTPSRSIATASVVDGKIYVIGGMTTGFIDVADNDSYDPISGIWDTTLAPMPTPRSFSTSAVVNGIIYVIGGGYPTSTNKNEAYDPATDTWTPKANLPGPPKLAMRADVIDGIIYVVGGNYFQNDCYAYDPSTDTWATLAPIPVPSGGGALSVTAYNGLIYTFGSSNYSPWAAFSYVFAYNPQTNTWDTTTLTPMPTSRFGLYTYLVNGKIYAIGGSQAENTSLATVEVYNPVTNTWGSEPDMPNPYCFFAGAVADNKIYVIAGTSDWNTSDYAVWEYDPTVPVELTSFAAIANGKAVTLNWSTATELNNFEFEVQRSFEGSEIVTVGVVYGKGTTTERQDYTYCDKNLSDGKYSYRLKQVDYNGSYEYSHIVEVDFRAFNSYLLEQNYPNPFNPTTTIGFGIQNKSNVKITILNAIGEEVALVMNEEKEAGFHQVKFDAICLPSGVYYYQLKAGDFISTKKMILMK